MSNKVNKKPAMKNEKSSKKCGSCYFTMGKFLLISVIFGGLLAWYINKRFTTIPEMPHLDPNEWWGPYPIDMDVDETLQPYKIEFSDVMVNDLRERLLHHRPFTPPLENVGFKYGFNSKFLTQILHYWKNNYNFKEREDHLNRYDHFMTNIQGLNIHYMHVKPEDASDVEVVPLLMMHGWPGSICEFYDIIPKLTTPRPGYKFVFELIIPSLPGFGFSQGAVRSGLGAPQIAVIMNNLMQRIGREKYYVQGGDLGHVVASIMATLYPNNVLGFHTNLPVVVFNPYTSLMVMLGSLWPSLTVEAEEESRMYPIMDHLMRLLEESGYMHIQATKPDTVGIGLSDSPAGLAAYILEKFSMWTNPESKNSGDGNLLDKFPLTYLLDNVMMYWASNSITTSMRVYAETLSSKDPTVFDMNPTDVPTWGIKFKHELIYQPDYVLKKKYRNYLHTTLVDDGGHFAAMENPDLLADDIFYAVTTFIEFHKEQTQQADPQPEAEKSPQSVYEFIVKDLNGRDVKLEKFRGYVLLIVNVASECGLTDSNYHQLNELYEKYRDRGLRILAFPCNQFGSQEPGDAKEIFSFTKKKGVKFDVFQKIDVNGDNAHPLWKFLKSAQGGTLGDFIKWNFSKFIVDRNGVPVERLAPNVSPLELEPYLAKYW